MCKYSDLENQLVCESPKKILNEEVVNLLFPVDKINIATVCTVSDTVKNAKADSLHFDTDMNNLNNIPSSEASKKDKENDVTKELPTANLGVATNSTFLITPENDKKK